MYRLVSGGIVVLLAVAPVIGQTAEQKKATISYLQKLQNKDGGFRPNPAVDASSLRATSSALRALKYFGGEVPDRAAAAEFVKKCHDRASGGFADTPGGKPDVAVTAVGIMALVELKIPTEPYEAGAIKYLGDNVKTFEDIRIAVAGLEAIGKKAPENEKWIRQVQELRLPDKEPPARDLGGATVALLRMGFKTDRDFETRVLSDLNHDERKDGGFGKKDVPNSDLETTYRVMRCYHMLKAKPDKAATLREFVAKCRNDDGGYGVAPGEKSAVGPTYFASIILHWLDEK
jgi:prenyltransferase beta subunit